MSGRLADEEVSGTQVFWRPRMLNLWLESPRGDAPVSDTALGGPCILSQGQDNPAGRVGGGPLRRDARWYVVNEAFPQCLTSPRATFIQ